MDDVLLLPEEIEALLGSERCTCGHLDVFHGEHVTPGPACGSSTPDGCTLCT